MEKKSVSDCTHIDHISLRSTASHGCSEAEGISVCASANVTSSSVEAHDAVTSGATTSTPNIPEFTWQRDVSQTPSAEGLYECKWSILSVPPEYAFLVGIRNVYI